MTPSGSPGFWGPAPLLFLAGLIAFTGIWIALLLLLARPARVAFYVEGFVSGTRGAHAVRWSEVASMHRDRDPEASDPDWTVETHSGDVVRLPCWLVDPDLDLTPLRDRGFELPAS